jgi:hypothetical protein
VVPSGKVPGAVTPAAPFVGLVKVGDGGRRHDPAAVRLGEVSGRSGRRSEEERCTALTVTELEVTTC